MKIILISLGLCLLTVLPSLSQDIEVTKEDSKSINHFASSIHNCEQFSTTQPRLILIKLFECENSVKSLQNGTDVILYDLYIYIKEAVPESGSSNEYYWIKGKFLNPRDYKFDSTSQTLSFKHGSEESTTTTNLQIGVKEIAVQ